MKSDQANSFVLKQKEFLEWQNQIFMFFFCEGETGYGANMDTLSISAHEVKKQSK